MITIIHVNIAQLHEIVKFILFWIKNYVFDLSQHDQT
jgi:hypothetical protein